MKTLNVGAVYLAAYEAFEDVSADLSRFIDAVYNSKRPHSANVSSLTGSSQCATQIERTDEAPVD